MQLKDLFSELPYEYSDIDHVAVATEKIVHTNLWNLAVYFDISDYLKLHRKYFYPILNDLIKKRDFWIPFTSSILDECYDSYAVNPKNIQSSYMSNCFDSTALAKSHLSEAIHPYDYTVRPQKVTKKTCPKYYALMKEFYNISGIGALLNTSLNIDEKLIVQKPTDILNEILTSTNIPLEYIYIENTLYKRKAI